jgi:outer membrane receptor for ferrienterochelin and colicin
VKKLVLLASSALVLPTIAVMAPVPAIAQQITTSITGKVTNEAGQPLGNATVAITDTRTGASREISTDSQGLFSAENLTTGGPYTITATAEGHQGQTVEQVVTSLQGATELTFSLSPVTAEVAADTIVVTGTRARVTQLEVGPGSSFGTEVLQNAPSFNRDVRDIIRLDPRVSLDREDASSGGSGADRISCLGGNDRGNSFTVDGILQNDVYGLNDTGFSSRSSTPIPYDAVRETQVQFAPFDVEYGQFTGCTINVVTKGGTNKFHGGAFFEYSDDSLRGNKVKDREVGPIEPDKRWGISVGGPIIKDRLFFFGAYEQQKGGFTQDVGPAGAGYPNEIEGVSIEDFNEITDTIRELYGIDSGPLITSRPFTNKRWFGRLDWQINDDHRLEATYQRLNESTVQSDDNATSTFPQNAVGSNTFYFSGTKSNYYSGRLYSNWTDNLSTELRYSRSKIQDLQDPVGGGEAQDDPILRIIVGVDNPTGVDGTVQVGPGFSRSANDLRTTVDQYRALANYDAGNHRLKFGFELNRTKIFNLFVQNATGTLTFRNLADLEQGLLSPGFGNNSTFPDAEDVVDGLNEGAYINASRTGDVNDAAAKFKRSIYSLYAQDDWRINDDFSLVLGLRTDWYSGGHPDENPAFEERYGFKNTTGFSDLSPTFLPRLGFTYTPADFSVFSRPKIQGGVGIFSGGDPVVWFANAFQNNGFGFAEGTTQAAGCPGGQIDVLDGSGNFSGFPQCAFDSAVDRAAQGAGDAQSVDPDITVPTVFRANLGFQSDLNFASEGFFSGWRANLDYIYSFYRNPFTIVDLSQTLAITRAVNSPFGPGFTIDGRPIYAAIDPTDPDAAGCGAQLVSVGAPPVWSNVTAACFNSIGRDDELMLTNSKGYRSHILSAILSKNFDQGVFTPDGNVFFTAGYSYTNAQDRRNMFNSTAGSNFDQTAAFDRQNPSASRGFFESRHNFTLSTTFREKFFGDLATTLGFSFVARSGRPYSLTFNGGGVFNDSASGNNNALIYLPTGVDDPNIAPTSNMTAVQQLVDFAKDLDCAKDHLGESIDRNTCLNDWYYDLDLRFSQELPGLSRLTGVGGANDKFTFYAMFDNFLNFLNKDWNVQHRRNFAGLQVIGNTSGVNSDGQYIITALPGGQTSEERFKADRFINTSSSVWRVKVGVSYEF